jgi:hypothetical protein
LAFTDDVGVLSVEVLRGPQEDLSSALEEAAEVLVPSRVLASDEVRRLTLVVAGRSVDPSSRVAAYNVERDKLWAALEREGRSIPAGRRLESRIQYDDGSFGFVGIIDLELSELSRALGITRELNAVCIGTGVSEPEQIADQIVSSLASRSADSRSLLRVLVTRANQGDLILRGYGEFDDRNVGVEVFAKDEILNRIADDIDEIT